MAADASQYLPRLLSPPPLPLCAAGVGRAVLCRAKPGAKCHEDASGPGRTPSTRPGTSSGFGAASAASSLPGARDLPADVRAGCRPPSGGLFYIVSSLWSSGELCDGWDAASEREAEFRASGEAGGISPGQAGAWACRSLAGGWARRLTGERYAPRFRPDVGPPGPAYQ